MTKINKYKNKRKTKQNEVIKKFKNIYLKQKNTKKNISKNE